MTRLTKVAIMTRKIIRFSVLGMVMLVVLRVAVAVGTGVYQNYFGQKTPPPNVEFGKMPKIPFPAVSTDDYPKFSYTLETVEGSVPKLDNQARVYYMPKANITLLSLDSARVTATLLGFSGEPEQVNSTVYRFPHQKLPARLEMNIATKIFSISYELKDFFIPFENRPPAPEVAVERAKSILTSANVFPADLTGNTSYQFLRVENKNLVGVPSLSEANLVKVNLYRKQYNKYPSMPPYPSQANVWFILTGSGSGITQLLAGDFYYYPVDETKFATYPLRTSQQAYEDLQAGKGYIASLGNNEDGNVTLRKVYLAYYDPDTITDFYQPIFVFEGDRNFTAYVPAVSYDYYEQ